MEEVADRLLECAEPFEFGGGGGVAAAGFVETGSAVVVEDLAADVFELFAERVAFGEGGFAGLTVSGVFLVEGGETVLVLLEGFEGFLVGEGVAEVGPEGGFRASGVGGGVEGGDGGETLVLVGHFLETFLSAAVGVDAGFDGADVGEGGFEEVVADEAFEVFDGLECHGAGERLVHFRAAEPEMGAEGHFVEIGGLAIPDFGVEVAAPADSEFVFGEEGQGIRGGAVGFEEVGFFDAFGDAEPCGARACGGAVVFDAGSPCFAALGAVFFWRPREFEACQGDAGGTEVAFLAVAAEGIGVAETVAAERAAAACAGGGFVEAAGLFAEEDELDEVEEGAFA